MLAVVCPQHLVALSLGRKREFDNNFPVLQTDQCLWFAFRRTSFSERCRELPIMPTNDDQPAPLSLKLSHDGTWDRYPYHHEGSKFGKALKVTTNQSSVR